MIHKRHKTAPDQAPEEAMKSKKSLEIVEKEGVWIKGNDEWIEDTQGEAWGMSSDSSSIVLLDGEEEDGTHTSNQHYFNMILSKGIADWYESVAEKTASNKRPRHYSGNSRTSKWRASQDAKRNGQTIMDLFKPAVSTQTQGQIRYS